MNMNKKLATIILAALLVWNVILSYFVYVLSNQDNVVVNPGQQTQIVQNLTTIETDFTKVVEDNASKAVGITTYVNNIQYGSGSGAIYQVVEDGVIVLTNNHVIESATSVYVSFANGETLGAELIGADELSDLAVLKVKPDFDVQAFTLGDSSLVKVGEWVLAIGSPLSIDFSGSVTVGIISGKDRIIEVDLNNDGIADWDLLMLQTSAAVNPGNSGGPLLNIAGELIAINTIKYSGTNIEGMAFSIPINEVVPIVEQLLQQGKVTRPMIGIGATSIKDIPTYARSYYGISLNLDYGVFVSSVTEGGAAKIAGLKDGDIILELNGTRIENLKEFRKLLYSLQPGDSITIKYQRGDSISEVEAVLQ